MLALHLPNKLILPDALQFAQEAINSPEVHVRAAACTVIVDVAEGCSDALRKKLLPVLQARPCCKTYLNMSSAMTHRAQGASGLPDGKANSPLSLPLLVPLPSP